ncbi:MAG TPA: PAS-domain containing protein, partial [Stellaceae bacterium]|nr:PAS-domain containing protein [Stellaceae bacterium]
MRYRLVLLVVVSVLPLLGFNLWRQYSEYRGGIAASGERTLALARSMALLVDAELHAPIATLEALATSSALQRGDLETFRQEAEVAAARQFPGTNIVLLKENGQQFVNTILPRDAPLPVRPNVDSVRQVFATNRPAVSNLYQGAVGARQVIAIDVPVRDTNGSLRYALSMVLSTGPRLAMFDEVIRRQRLPETWVVSIFDRNGVNVARVPNGDRFVGQQAAATLIGPLRSAAAGVLQTTSLEGIELLTAFSHAAQSGWSVAIGVPRSELTQPFVEATARELAIGAILLALGSLAAIWAARGIAAPIQSLLRVAAVAEREELPVPPPTGLPEVDAVATALHTAESDRRRSREAETMLRDGLETMAQGFVLYDDQDRLVMCNESYRNFYPETAADLVPGMTFAEILRLGTAHGRFPDAIGREEEWIAERVRRQREPVGTIEQRLADGRWVLVTKHRLANGWVVGFRVDITAVKAAQEAETILRDGIETIPEGFSIYDGEDRLVMCNEAYRNLFPGRSDYVTVGARYEDILRSGIALGHYQVLPGGEEQWIAARLRDHRTALAAIEQKLSDGRWVLSTKRRLSNGWTAGLRVDITALKAAQTALAVSEHRFQDIAEVSGDWMWETDREHRFNRLFGERAESLPIRPQSVIGRTRWEAAGGDLETDELWAHHKADLDARRPFRNFRYEISSPGGARMFVSASGKPVFDEDGSFAGYRGTATDETAMVEAQRRAEAADARLRDAIESISAGFVITDPDDRFVLFNQQYRNFYPDFETTLRPGAPYEDFLRERIRRGYYPGAKGHEEEWFAEVMARHRAASTEVEIQLPNGRWLLLSERHMSDGSVAGVSLDITALKATQQALAHRQEQLNRAQRLAQMGSDIRNLKTDEAEWSAETYRIFGVSPATFVPSTENFLAMVLPEDRPKVLETRSLIAQGITPRPFEYRITRPDGEIRQVYRESEIVNDANGTP